MSKKILEHKPTSFDRIDENIFLIKKEISEGRELSAFLLGQGFIEAYLREWLITGKKAEGTFKAKPVEDIERIGPRYVLAIHTILGNIDATMYKKILSIIDLRNEIAHELAQIDILHDKNKKKLKKSANHAMHVYKEIFTLYKQDIDSKARSMIKNEIQ